MICDGHLHYWLRLKVDTTWPWMWRPQLYRTHQYTEQLELSLFVVLYADRIGVVGGYWIPESLVCHGHPPTRCHAPPPPPSHLPSPQYTECRWSYLSVLNCPRIGIFLLLRTPGPVPLGLAYVLPVETNPDTTWPWMWHPNTYNRAHQYTEELELSLFVLLFSAKIWRFLLLYCVGTTCSGLALLNKCMTWCLYKLSANMPTPPPLPPFSAAAATDQNGVSKYFILYMKIHRAPG